MKKILPILLAIIGLGGGIGVGKLLQPAPKATEINPCGDVQPVEEAPAADQSAGTEFVKMNNQFVVPVVKSGKVTALVVLSLSLEVETGQTETVYKHEPKFRDEFLQVMFEHANVGGFDGSFTANANMRVLRQALTETANKILPGIITSVLITDIARQST